MRRCTIRRHRLTRLVIAIAATLGLLAILFASPIPPAGAALPPLSGTLVLDEPEGNNPDTHGTVAYEVTTDTGTGTMTISFVIAADDGDGETPLTVTEVQYCDLATPINWPIDANTCAGQFRDADGDPMEGEDPQIKTSAPWVFSYDPAQPYWTLHVVAGGRTLYVLPEGNETQLGSLDLLKTDDATPPAALAGAVFRLTGPSSYSQDRTTDSTGKAFWGGLPAGTYTLTEISVPTGYTVLASSAGGIDSAGKQFTIPSVAGETTDWTLETTVKNHKIPPTPPLIPEFGAVRVEKTGIGDDPLAGAEFTLYTDVFPVGGVPLVGDIPTAMKATTDANGVAVIGSVPFGNYWLVETVVPAGYEEVAAQHVAVTGTQQLTFSVENEPLDSDIELVKTGDAKAHVGDVVDYTFFVENTGELDLTDVTLEDAILDADAVLTDDGDGDDVLEIGEQWIYTGTHTVTADDPDPMPNTGVVRGVDMFGRARTDADDHEVDLIHPAIQIVKTAAPTSAAIGATVTYSFVITNTGDTTLFDVAVTDNVLGAIGTIDELGAGASQTLTKAVVLAAGAAATNVGTATGADELGKVVTDTDDETITIVAGEQIIKPTVKPAVLARTGENIDLAVVTGMALIMLGAMALLASRFRRLER